MNLQPLDDRIVVRTAEAEETTVSGLVIPDTAKEKPQQGEVLAVGPGRRSDDTGELIPLDIAVGDTVVYSKYGGTEILGRGRGPPHPLEPGRAGQGPAGQGQGQEVTRYTFWAESAREQLSLTKRRLLQAPLRRVEQLFEPCLSSRSS